VPEEALVKAIKALLRSVRIATVRLVSVNDVGSFEQKQHLCSLCELRKEHFQVLFV